MTQERILAWKNRRAEKAVSNSMDDEGYDVEFDPMVEQQPRSFP